MNDVINRAERIVAGADIDASLKKIDYLVDLFTEQLVRQESMYRLTIKKLIQLKEKLVKEREGLDADNNGVA
jgi:nitrate reductase assembly molybdenum cofactor insertion protein NarJ